MPISRIFKKMLLLPLVVPFVSMPGRSAKYTEIVLSQDEQAIESRIKQHIEHLCTTIGERNSQKPLSLQAAANYITAAFEENGYKVKTQPLAPDSPHGSNLIAELPGNTDQIFVIGAHYDTVVGSPGANDNGSGIATMLEMARHFQSIRLPVTLRFVAFANEEHPGEPPESMGSYLYAKTCRENGDNIVGMWSLETIGCYSNVEGSQNYPSPFNLFYPTRGNFVAFIGDEQSRKLVRKSVRTFRKLRAFPSEGLAAPQKFKDVGRSDHWGFWQAGYPALMVTDTANFRYAQYHTSADQASVINYQALARVIRLLTSTVEIITQRHK